jgi:hypothetical protein
MYGNVNDFIFCCVELLAGGASRFCPGKEASQKVHGTRETAWDICTGWLVIQTDLTHGY